MRKTVLFVLGSLLMIASALAGDGGASVPVPDLIDGFVRFARILAHTFGLM